MITLPGTRYAASVPIRIIGRNRTDSYSLGTSAKTAKRSQKFFPKIWYYNKMKWKIYFEDEDVRTCDGSGGINRFTLSAGYLIADAYLTERPRPIVSPSLKRQDQIGGKLGPTC